MSFVRPEVVSGLKRWSEALIGGAVLLWGLRWAVFSGGILQWVGVAVALAGLTYAWAGIQRARFRAGSGGLGVVEVDERQITYLAPVGGGIVSLDALRRVDIARDRLDQPMWRFDMAGERLSIPAGAAGAGALFDVLTALPGAEIETAIRTLRAPPEAPVTIWRRGAGSVDTPRPIAHS